MDCSGIILFFIENTGFDDTLKFRYGFLPLQEWQTKDLLPLGKAESSSPW